MSSANRTTLADILLHTLGEPRGFKSSLLINSLDWSENRERVRYALMLVLPEIFQRMRQAEDSPETLASLAECFGIVVLISSSDQELFWQLTIYLEDFILHLPVNNELNSVALIFKQLVYGTIEPAMWISYSRSESELDQLKQAVRNEARRLGALLKKHLSVELIDWANHQYHLHDLSLFFPETGSC